MEVLVEHGLILLALLLVPAGVVVTVVADLRRHRAGLAAGWACIVIAVVLLLRVRYAEFWAIDHCLDQGGRWNEASETCEL